VRLINYIPTSDLIHLSNNLEFIEEKDATFYKENGLFIVDPALTDETGADVFNFQYSPEMLTFSGGANYVHHKAKSAKPIMEYVNSELDKFPLGFFVIRDIRSELDGNRSIPLGGSMGQVIKFVQELCQPTLKTNKPPEIHVIWGELIFVGVAERYQVKIHKSYPDNTPKIIEIRLNITGDLDYRGS